MQQHPSPYCTVEVRPGHFRLQPDYAASRAIAAEMLARERAAHEAARPLWRKLAQRLRGSLTPHAGTPE